MVGGKAENGTEQETKSNDEAKWLEHGVSSCSITDSVTGGTGGRMCLSKTDVCCCCTVVRQVLGIFGKSTLILRLFFLPQLNVFRAALPAGND